MFMNKCNINNQTLFTLGHPEGELLLTAELHWDDGCILCNY